MISGVVAKVVGYSNMLSFSITCKIKNMHVFYLLLFQVSLSLLSLAQVLSFHLK